MEYFLFSTLVLVMLSHLKTQSLCEAKTTGFVIDLIHRHSKLSPFYNHSITAKELSALDALRSMARTHHFRPSPPDSNKIESNVIPNGGDYLMKISLGSPPVETLAIADTGSDLVWTQCAPCDQCYPQDSPLFDPSKSSTYQPLSCDSAPCQDLPKKGCSSSTNSCMYMYSYGDQSHTNGVLSKDTFTFSSDQKDASFEDSVFGCGYDNDGTFNSRGSGIVGLGRGSLSLVSQLSSETQGKFSYCLLPRTADSVSKLRFGEEAIISAGSGVVSTPLQSGESDSFYYLSLEGASIGNKNIPIQQTATGSRGNIIIDSGTTLTLLEPNFYDEVETAVRDSIGLAYFQGGNYRLCYTTSFSSLPEISVVFHFTGADVTLNKLNLFRPITASSTCFTLMPSHGVSIFGNYAQMNFQVLYDLSNNQISFAPADCTKY